MWRWETLVALGNREGAVGRRSGELSGLGRQKRDTKASIRNPRDLSDRGWALCRGGGTAGPQALPPGTPIPARPLMPLIAAARSDPG